MEKLDKTTPPKENAADTAHALAKAGISAIPGIGGPAAELFSLVIAPPINKRRQEWMESVADALHELEKKTESFKIEDLSKNEAFVTCVMHATTAAIKNHQKEKLEALKNAVLNTALKRAPEDDVQLMFLEFVDTLTPWHLRLLKFFDGPQEWVEKHKIMMPSFSACGIGTIIENAFPELRGRRDFYDQLGKDLHARGLIGSPNFHVTGTFAGIFRRGTTDFGRSFIAFISPPLDA